jgi:hypothetical protein
MEAAVIIATIMVKEGYPVKIKHTVFFVACLALLLTALLSGCGSSSVPSAQTQPKPPATPAASAKIIEPCDLISKADAQQYIGEPLKDPEKKETPVVGLKLCVYNTVTEGSGKYLQIGLTQQSFMPANGQTPKSLYDALKNNFKNAVKIDGVGDDAFISPPGLHVLKGGYYLTIASGNSNDPKTQELLKTIGKKAVDKL